MIRRLFSILFLSQLLTAAVAATPYRAGQVIVKFKSADAVQVGPSGAGLPARVASPLVGRKLKQIGMTDVKPLSSLYVVSFDSLSTTVEQAVNELNALDEVEFAEPNYLRQVVGMVPSAAAQTSALSPYYNDPLAADQWYLDAINLPALWQQPVTDERRPVIAILDTGVDTTHPDLADNIYTGASGWNFIDDTDNVYDDHGHGTHCAGIAAAVADNGVGISGANPGALILPVKVLDAGGYGYTDAIIRGIDYAVACGADILSMSFGAYEHSQAEEEALRNAAGHALLVGAAGNEGVCMRPEHSGVHGYYVNNHAPFYPAASRYVVGVMATDEQGVLADFSNFDCDGPLRTLSQEEDDTAPGNYELRVPGVSILSTLPGGAYGMMDGTSMACPLAVGAISRLLQCRDYADRDELLRSLLYATGGQLDVMAAYTVSADELAKITFTADIDGVTMKFVQTADGECQLGDGLLTAIATDTQGAVTIPETVRGLAVTTIAANAFNGCSQLTEVTLPFCVSALGSKSFHGCPALARLTVKNSVPPLCAADAFDAAAYASCALIVPSGYIGDYGNADIWAMFQSRQKMELRVGEVFWATVEGVPVGMVVTGTSPKTVQFGPNQPVFYFGYEGAFEVPEVVEGYTVTSIGTMAFYNCTGLTQVMLPPTIKYIGQVAFTDCSMLERVNLPEGLEVIDMAAFSGCTKLTQLDIPSTLIVIADGALSGIAVSEVVLPEGLQVLGGLALADCPNLAEVRLPSSLLTLGSGAFSHSGVSAVNIPEQISEIPDYTFYGCTNMRQFDIPEHVTSIGMMSFSDTGLESVLIPSTVSFVTDAFSGCSAMTSMAVDAGNPFYDSREGCNAIIRTEDNTIINGCTTTVIPESVTGIASRAFCGTGISSVHIGPNVNDIGAAAFADCHKLTTMTVDDANPIYDSREGSNAIITTADNTLIVGCNGTTVPSSVQTIGRCAFGGSDIVSITLPEGVAVLDELAFQNCFSLKEISLPQSLRTIENEAFQNCWALKSIDLPDDLEEMGMGVFYNNKSLMRAKLPAHMQTVPTSTFVFCTSLSDVTFPVCPTAIGGAAFQQCGFEHLVLPDNIRSIDDFAFAGNPLEWIRSEMTEPMDIPDNCFMGLWFNGHNDELTDGLYETATLYVPVGTRPLYMAAAGWNKFANIVEADEDGVSAAVTARPMPGAVYTISGRRADRLQPGVNIMVSGDGTVKKVVVR